MTLQFYVNALLAAIGTGWAIVWLWSAVDSFICQRYWRLTQHIRETVGPTVPRYEFDALRDEHRALMDHLRLKYDHVKDSNMPLRRQMRSTREGR